ncbi:2-hydroxyacid dehydrogenase [Rhizobium sp. NLR17b]|uniref:2-hydroxyacid dehydrogenase n=1 Tax=Rhizobium sp. NLR17b TaxID=2731114 RepID=UPI001C83577D|nr:2-hydroxyacid dehydrogenase [Rhizobium sp. NLR17b]MBX5273232.1 2-hydroxyacid dehydrogenase [Rhizobium sp. NLR17b]
MREIIALKYANPAYPAKLGHLFDFVDCSKGFGALAETDLKKIKVLVTAGLLGASDEEMSMLPNLGLIACVGTGFENVDLSAARGRGILVTHGAGVNAGAVADQALGLLLSAVRGIPRQDSIARAGGWNAGWKPAPMVSGKKVGIYGMGRIGEAIAKRAIGFDMQVMYFSRSRKEDLPYRYLPTLLELADACDFLVSCVPGGEKTHHSISREVLRALGPSGYFVNVGRGTAISSEVLASALSDGTIAGAGLDVYDTEPTVPEALRGLENVVLTLHTASYAPEIQEITAAALAKNIQLFLDEGRVITPVPGMPSSSNSFMG